MKTAVFTSKYIIEENMPILYVVHDEDGDWQFLSKEETGDKSEARVVALDEIIELDSTIEEILWLPAGTEACRENVGAEWTTAV